MKILKNSILSSLLLSSIVLGASYGNDAHAVDVAKTNLKVTSPSTEGTNKEKSTEEPSNEKSTEEKSTEEPSKEKPTEEPSTEEPSKEKPTEEPSTEEPSKEKPTEEPSTEEPSKEKPTEEPSTEEPSKEKPTEEPSTEEPSKEKPTEEPSTEEPSKEIPTEEPSTEEPPTSGNSNDINNYNNQNIDHYVPTLPMYPDVNTNEGSYADTQTNTEVEAPKFIPGKAEAYYEKMDRDMLELVTSKVGTRPDLAKNKVSKTAKSAETTSVSDHDSAQATDTTTKSIENTNNKEEISKPLIFGVSAGILIILGLIILFIKRKFMNS